MSGMTKANKNNWSPYFTRQVFLIFLKSEDFRSSEWIPINLKSRSERVSDTDSPTPQSSFLSGLSEGIRLLLVQDRETSLREPALPRRNHDAWQWLALRPTESRSSAPGRRRRQEGSLSDTWLDVPSALWGKGPQCVMENTKNEPLILQP